MTNENINKPYSVRESKGRNYFICSCKYTKRQPFCDRAYIDTDNQPYVYKVWETKKYIFVDAKTLEIFHFVMGT